LAKKVRLLYKQYKAGDAKTVSRLQPLFTKPESGDAVDEDDPKPDGDNDPGVEGNEGEDPKFDDNDGSGADDDDDDEYDDPGAGDGKCIKPSIIPKYLPFQQAAIREMVKKLSPEEDATVMDYIEAEYAAALKVWEFPWLATAKAGDDADDLQRKYYQKSVFITPSCIQALTYFQECKTTRSHPPSCHRGGHSPDGIRDFFFVGRTVDPDARHRSYWRVRLYLVLF
jgi:hypothetical protein